MKSFENIIDDFFVTGPKEKPDDFWNYGTDYSSSTDNKNDSYSSGSSLTDAYDAWQAAEKAKKEKADKEFEAWFLYEESKKFKW